MPTTAYYFEINKINGKTEVGDYSAITNTLKNRFTGKNPAESAANVTLPAMEAASQMFEGDIQEDEEELSYIESLNVDHVSGEMKIIVHGEIKPDDIIEKVEEIGFHAVYKKSDKKENSITFDVTGMTCGSCSATISNYLSTTFAAPPKKKSIDEANYIKELYINQEAAEIKVILNGYIEPKSIINKVEEIGFGVDRLQVREHKDENSISFKVEGRLSDIDRDRITKFLKEEFSSPEEKKISDAIVMSKPQGSGRIIDVDVNLEMNRLMVKAQGNINIEAITDILKSDLGFTSKLLTNERELSFVIKGLDSKDDAAFLEKALMQDKGKRSYTKSAQMIYASKVLKVVIPVGEQVAAIRKTYVKKIIADVQSVSESFEAEEEKSSIHEVEQRENYLPYIINIIINGLIIIVFMNIKVFIPPPITWMGQLIGLGLSLITLAAMGFTGKEFYKAAWAEFQQSKTFYKELGQHVIRFVKDFYKGVKKEWAYYWSKEAKERNYNWKKFGQGIKREFSQAAYNFYQAFNHSHSSMNTLVALGTGSALIYSLLIALVPELYLAGGEYQFLAVNMILFIVNLGKGIKTWMQELARQQVRDLKQVFQELQPQTAKKVVLDSQLTNDKALNKIFDFKNNEDSLLIEEIGYKEIRKGDIICVDSNERFPVEGVVLKIFEVQSNGQKNGPAASPSDHPIAPSESGDLKPRAARVKSSRQAQVSEQTLTGETSPRTIEPGDEVFSGGLTNKRVYIKAIVDGPDGRLHRVFEDVANSAKKKTSFSKTIDQAARIFAPTIVLIGFAASVIWLATGASVLFSLNIFMSVLLCACPCALGLAAPLSMTSTLYKLQAFGILVHDASVLEPAAQVDTVVFDKTGTLTKLEIDDIYLSKSDGQWDESKLLRYTASVEQIKGASEHPIAKAILARCKSEQLLACTDFQREEQGVSGRVDNVEVVVGNLGYLASKQINIAPEFKAQELKYASGNVSSIGVAVNGKCVAVMSLRHVIREDAKKCIVDLKRMGIDVWMCTGDKRGPAQKVAEALDIPHNQVYAEHPSKKKAEFINELKKKGRVVCMVGDGANDIEPIAGADVGIAVGPWTKASSSAKIALQKLNLTQFFLTVKQTEKNINRNLFISGIYNIVSILIASGLFYYWGLVLVPVAASALMSLPSLMVTVNSLLLPFNIDNAINQFEGKEILKTRFLHKVSKFFNPYDFIWKSKQNVKNGVEVTPPPSPVKLYDQVPISTDMAGTDSSHSSLEIPRTRSGYLNSYSSSAKKKLVYEEAQSVQAQRRGTSKAKQESAGRRGQQRDQGAPKTTRQKTAPASPKKRKKRSSV